ncbi:hypothetical protein D3C87_1512320 [compost metagenome]
MRTHGAGTPNAYPYTFGITAGFFPMAIKHFFGKLLPYLPGRFGRQYPWVDGVEIPSRGQDMRHPACRRAARSRRHVPAREPMQEIGDFVVGAGEVRHEVFRYESQYPAQTRQFRQAGIPIDRFKYDLVNGGPIASVMFEKPHDVRRHFVQGFQHIRSSYERTTCPGRQILRRRGQFLSFLLMKCFNIKTI